MLVSLGKGATSIKADLIQIPRIESSISWQQEQNCALDAFSPRHWRNEQFCPAKGLGHVRV
jgi:hypothetical protein